VKLLIRARRKQDKMPPLKHFEKLRPIQGREKFGTMLY
jgi:hypothetical protein